MWGTTVQVERVNFFGEPEWLAGTDAETMAWLVQGHYPAQRIGLAVPALRKIRLFACHCARFLWPALTLPESRKAVEVAEAFADGRATQKALKAAFRKANVAARSTGSEEHPCWVANNAAWETPYAWASVNQLLAYAELSPSEGQAVRHFLGSCLFDMFGNPYRRMALAPAWLTPNVRSLAEAIYDERAFDRMPILADAMEDAGCTNADVLNHCRGAGPHVRGCWCIDLVLGKE
jgi:hypothetical protein